jgi:hypothetical protein
MSTPSREEKTGRLDLYKDKDGNIIVKPKGPRAW